MQQSGSLIDYTMTGPIKILNLHKICSDSLTGCVLREQCLGNLCLGVVEIYKKSRNFSSNQVGLSTL